MAIEEVKVEKEKVKKVQNDSAFKRLMHAKETPVFIILILICVVLSILTPTFLTSTNILTTLVGMSANGIVAIAMTIILAMGGIDLSVGSVMCLSSMIAAKIVQGGGNIGVGILVGMIFGIACGVANGFFIAKLKLTPFIMTLAMMSIARGSSMLLSSGKSVAISKEFTKFLFLGQGYIGGKVPMLVLIFAILAVIFGFLLKKTKPFRNIYYIGSNEKAARLSGVNVDKTKLGVYTLSAAMSAFAGILCLSRFGTATTTTGNGVEMTAISAAVIGGASLDGGLGSVVGAVIGIALLNVVDDGLILLHVSVYGQDLISGIILLIAVTMDVLSNRRRAA